MFLVKLGSGMAQNTCIVSIERAPDLKGIYICFSSLDGEKELARFLLSPSLLDEVARLLLAESNLSLDSVAGILEERIN